MRQFSSVKTKGFHDKYMPLPLWVGNFHLVKVSQPSPWYPGPYILNKSQSNFNTYPHGGFKRACQDVINWKLSVIAPDLIRNRKLKPSEVLLFLFPNYPIPYLQ